MGMSEFNGSQSLSPKRSDATREPHTLMNGEQSSASELRAEVEGLFVVRQTMISKNSVYSLWDILQRLFMKCV
jgi:hypothetical protein